MKSNDSKNLITMKIEDFIQGEHIDRFREFIDHRILIYIKYESVYGEEFEIGRTRT